MEFFGTFPQAYPVAADTFTCLLWAGRWMLFDFFILTFCVSAMPHNSKPKFGGGSDLHHNPFRHRAFLSDAGGSLWTAPTLMVDISRTRY